MTVPLRLERNYRPGPVFDPDRAYVYEMTDQQVTSPFQQHAGEDMPSVVAGSVERQLEQADPNEQGKSN